MTVFEIMLIAAAVMAASWHDRPLKFQACLMLGASVISLLTYGLGLMQAALVYICVDFIGVLAGLYVHQKWRGNNGLIFTVLSIVALTAHVALFSTLYRGGLSPGQVTDLSDWYKFTLNSIYALTALSVGGRGFVRFIRSLSVVDGAADRGNDVRFGSE